MTLSKIIPNITLIKLSFLITVSQRPPYNPSVPCLLRRFLPSLFKMLFPVPCPRPAEIINESGIARNELRRLAVWSIHNRALDSAFNKCKSCFGIFEAGSKLPRRDCVQRASEGIGVIERRIHRDHFAVRTWLEDFDDFQVAAVFEHRM